MLVRFPITPIGRILNNTIIKGWNLRDILVKHIVLPVAAIRKVNKRLAHGRSPVNYLARVGNDFR